MKRKRPSAPSKNAANKEQTIEQLARLVPRLMKDADVPGVSIALIRNGKIFWHRGFGVKNVETKDLITDSTIFEAASLSKTVFAYAALKLVEDGKLGLNVPLSRYLPAPYIENDARLNQITARRVLSHTTGLPNWRANGKTLKIYFTPGERFSYSGEGYVYLQKVVERLSGLPLEDFMQKTVFAPLGMNDSSYVWQPKYGSLKAYAHDSAGNLAGRSQPSEANAAASLQTTALDYAKFIVAIFQRTGIKDATVKEMLRPQTSVDATCAVCFERPASGKTSPDITWGLGWGLEKTSGGASFWHWGDNGNVKAFVAADDKAKAAIVVFTNSANGLSIADEITGKALGRRETALAWLDYEPYNSPAKTLLKNIIAGGEPAVLEYRNNLPNGTTQTLKESQINWIGYQLLGRKRYAEAIRIFEMNAADYPQSPNVYDSLGEAYLRADDLQLSLQNYRKAVQLSSRNANAVTAVRQLENAQIKIDPKVLETYIGEYETPFGIYKIVKEGDRLIGRVDGEPDMILLPQTETQFVVALGNIQLAFIKDERGIITQANFTVKEQQFPARKIK